MITIAMKRAKAQVLWLISLTLLLIWFRFVFFCCWFRLVFSINSADWHWAIWKKKRNTTSVVFLLCTRAKCCAHSPLFLALLMILFVSHTECDCDIHMNIIIHFTGICSTVSTIFYLLQSVASFAHSVYRIMIFYLILPWLTNCSQADYPSRQRE